MKHLRDQDWRRWVGLGWVLTLSGATFAAQPARSPSEDSGGGLLPEQAAFDVQRCELNLRIDPVRKSISGTAAIQVQALEPLPVLVLDLDPRLKVRRVWLRSDDPGLPGTRAPFERREGKLRILLHPAADRGHRVTPVIEYAGKPREAQNAPWDGGFTWAKTPDGQPWIATSVQGEGADLWWPCKDHPSDEPESLTLRVRVPNPLVVAANGRLVETIAHADRTTTYHWHTAFPINNYGVALNIAPYEAITTEYVSVTGEKVPATFWVLPQNRGRAEALFPELLAHVNFYERFLGPYPFRGEKYGVVETPHLGMEHQTIIAYGNKYGGGPHGYDWLHHHELGHEWWGNLVTAVDWRHFWLHEGLCTYMQALYAEEREGTMAYHHALYENRKRIRSRHALVPDGPTSMQQIEQQVGLDAYYKGAWILHTLRYLIGREATLTLLRRFAYPEPEMERWGDGRVCRFVSTADFVKLAGEVSGQDLEWFFNLYLKQPRLPKLVSEVQAAELLVRWETPEGYPFPMPVDVEVNGRVERLPIPAGGARLDAARYADARLDPQAWILKDPPAFHVPRPAH